MEGKRITEPIRYTVEWKSEDNIPEDRIYEFINWVDEQGRKFREGIFHNYYIPKGEETGIRVDLIIKIFK